MLGNCICICVCVYSRQQLSTQRQTHRMSSACAAPRIQLTYSRWVQLRLAPGDPPQTRRYSARGAGVEGQARVRCDPVAEYSSQGSCPGANHHRHCPSNTVIESMRVISSQLRLWRLGFQSVGHLLSALASLTRRQQCTVADVNVKLQLAADTMHVASASTTAHKADLHTF